MLVTCVDTRVRFCLRGRHSMTTEPFYRAIKKVRYCGFYASDLQHSQSNIQILVVEGRSILVDFLYFNLQWSHSVCSDQGVIVADKTQSRTVYCGKRLPWQYMHPQDKLSVKIYGLNSLLLPKYLYFFFNIRDHKKWQGCCKRMVMPNSLTFKNKPESSINDFYIVAVLKHVISLGADAFNRYTFFMFDGPGKRSPMYQLTSNISILSSTSQIVISALNTSHTDDRVTFTYIDQINGERLEKSSCFHYIARKGVMVRKINIQFAKENQSNYICHYMLHGSDGLFYRPYINIITLTFQGPTSHTETLVNACQYGGIYVHTKDADDELKLRMEMCGNIGEPTPSFISYKELDLLLSIIWYRGYSTGSFVADVQVMPCYIVPLPCSIYIKRTVYLSKFSSCNIFYMHWLRDTEQRHYCRFRLVSYNSHIIGPTELSVSTNANSAPDQHIATDVSVSTKSFNDWPHWTENNTHTLQLNYKKEQRLQREIKYLDSVYIRFRGKAQSDRLLKVRLKIAECLIREKSEFDFTVGKNLIVHSFCGEIQTIRSNQSFFFIYAPYDDTEQLTIYTRTSSHLCPTPPSSKLYVTEEHKQTRIQYNYTVTSTSLHFKSKHTASNYKFFLRYTAGYQNVSKDCALIFFVDFSYMDEKLQRNRNELVQLSGRRLTFHDARYLKSHIFQSWLSNTLKITEFYSVHTCSWIAPSRSTN